MFKFKKEFIPSNVIPYLIRNRTVERYNDDETLKQVQGDKATRPGFTLAEVLITLGIIGVVSAMTIPNLISNMQSEALAKKKLLFEERLEEAMNQMRFHEKLTGYSDAEDFVDELGKYLKINEVCDISDVDECFPATVISSCDTQYNTSDLVTGDDIAAVYNDMDFSSDNVGVIFADGTKALVNYDKNCEWLDPYDGGANREEATQCVAVLADVNGNSGKNTIGNDILPINSQFGFNISGTCWSLSNLVPTGINCTNTSGVDYSYCEGSTSYSADYWAGAMKSCYEQGKRLPTRQELADMHNYIFDTDIITATGDFYDLTLDEDKMADLNINIKTNSSEYEYWTSEKSSDTMANGRGLSSSHSRAFSTSTNRQYSYILARCVE
ncbi:MAG: type II secretion system protein [Candidatus Gastranaerophilales bacterium]